MIWIFIAIGVVVIGLVVWLILAAIYAKMLKDDLDKTL